MKHRYLIVLLGAVSGLFAQDPCFTIAGDQVTGGDLARAVPAFATIPRNAVLAPAPIPGGTRTFYYSELQSLASRFSVHLDAPRELCFQLATAPLDREKVLAALQKALNIPDAHIELIEISASPVPVGHLEFKRENLGAPASPDQATPVLWRGDVIYAGNRRLAIWARVRVTAMLNRVVAVEALKPGIAIKTGQVSTELVEGFPVAGGNNLSVDQIVGMMPLRSIAAGGEVRLNNLKRPNDVNRGDLVYVEVRIGAAHLALTGRAESAGHIGDIVAVRNPESSSIFRARVEGAGRVIVDSPAGEKD